MPDRPELTAEKRQLTGKAVSRLRRQGVLPAVVYGHGEPSEAIQLDAKAFDNVRRHAGRHAIVDLRLDGGRARPVLVQDIQEHPVRRHPLHVDFYLVRMTEEIAVDVPVVLVGTSDAAERMGGTLLHLLDTVKVRALPDDLPQTVELDVTPLDSFDAVLHVRDLSLPPRVSVVTDGDEPLARVQPPRVEEEPTTAEAAAPAAPPEAEAAVPETEGAGS